MPFSLGFFFSVITAKTQFSLFCACADCIFCFARLVFRVWDGMTSLGTSNLPCFTGGTSVLSMLLGRKELNVMEQKRSNI